MIGLALVAFGHVVGQHREVVRNDQVVFVVGPGDVRHATKLEARCLLVIKSRVEPDAHWRHSTTFRPFTAPGPAHPTGDESGFRNTNRDYPTPQRFAPSANGLDNREKSEPSGLSDRVREGTKWWRGRDWGRTFSTELAVEELDIRPDDYKVPKRRYSAFYGTDLEILLCGLKVETLLLTGGLTDVCVQKAEETIDSASNAFVPYIAYCSI